MEKISDKVKARLKELGKTQSDLAEHLDVSWNGLAKMLNRGTFKSDYMMRISKFLEVDINFFGLNSKQDSDNNLMHPPNETEDSTKVAMLKEIIRTKDDVIESQKELIATLKSKIKE